MTAERPDHSRAPWLRFAQAIGLTNLTDEEVEAYECLRDGGVVVAGAPQPAAASSDTLEPHGRAAGTKPQIRISRDPRDPRTGLFTPEYFIERLESESAAARPSQGEFSVAVLQIDAPGTAIEWEATAGQTLLTELAPPLHSGLRAEDMTTHLGQGEFAALLPETGMIHASGALKRLCRSLASKAYRTGGSTHHLRLRYGLCAHIGEQPASAGDLLERAQRNMIEFQSTDVTPVDPSQAILDSIAAAMPGQDVSGSTRRLKATLARLEHESALEDKPEAASLLSVAGEILSFLEAHVAEDSPAGDEPWNAVALVADVKRKLDAMPAAG